jgi:hypothetical protein
MQSTSKQTLSFEYENIQWKLMPPWVEHGIVKFPFTTTSEAQTFANMLVA